MVRLFSNMAQANKKGAVAGIATKSYLGFNIITLNLTILSRA